MRFLFEHSHTQATSERFLPRMHPQMSFQVPTHSELFTAVRTPVLSRRAGRRVLFTVLILAGYVLNILLT